MKTAGKRRKRASYETLLKKAQIRVHKGCCVYREQPIDLRHAAVDHIIPVSVLEGDPVQRAAVLTRFGFDPHEDFPTHGPRNRALTDQDFNRKKWMYVDGEWEEHIRKALRVAADTLEAMQAELDYLQLEERVGAMWEMLPAAARANAHRLHDRLVGEPQDRPSDESRTEDHMVVRRPAVTVSAHLPTVERPRGSMHITFHGLYSRAAGLVFEHEQIVGRLFAGFGADISHEQRPLIVYADPDGPVTVQLGTERLRLSHEEAEELCEALDRVALAYLGEMRRLEEKVFGSIGFPPSPEGYVLGTTDVATWAAIVRHARTRPAREGAEGICFRVEGARAITVFCADPNDPVCAPRARLHAELALSGYGSSVAPEVRLCWNPEDLAGDTEEDTRESHYVTGVRWTAKRTADWVADLVQALRPLPPRGWRRLRRTAPEWTPWFHLAARAKTASPVAEHDEFRSIASALGALGDMQHFFSRYGQRGVSARAQRGVYAMLLWALEASEPGGSAAAYVHLTLPVLHRVGGTADRLHRAIKALEDGRRSGATVVDYSLRCAMELLETAEWRVPPYRVLDAAEAHLRPLCDEYRAMDYLDSLALRPD